MTSTPIQTPSNGSKSCSNRSLENSPSLMQLANSASVPLDSSSYEPTCSRPHSIASSPNHSDDPLRIPSPNRNASKISNNKTSTSAYTSPPLNYVKKSLSLQP